MAHTKKKNQQFMETSERNKYMWQTSSTPLIFSKIELDVSRFNCPKLSTNRLSTWNVKNVEKGISFCITKSYWGSLHCNPKNSNRLIWTKTPTNVCNTMRLDPILCILVLVGWAPARIHLTQGYYWEASWYQGKAVPVWLLLEEHENNVLDSGVTLCF